MSNNEIETQYVKVFSSTSVFIIDQTDFLSLMKGFFNSAVEDVCDGFDWIKKSGTEMYFPNLKKNKIVKNITFNDEEECLQWFVNNEIIPPGNYLLTINI